MLLLAKKLNEISVSSLMAVYEEGNRENSADLWPDLPTEAALARAEQEFYQYLREVFFQTPGAVYGIWEEDGRYVSALRLEPYRDGLLLEALETAPACRRRGYGEQLLRSILLEYSGVRIYSHVHKKNLPSQKIHEKCGFRRISESAVYIDGSVNSKCSTYCREG